MKIVDGRPAKAPPTPTKFGDIETGGLYYDERYPESIFMKTSGDLSIDLKDGTEFFMAVSTVVKRIKGHLVVEEIEE